MKIRHFVFLPWNWWVDSENFVDDLVDVREVNKHFMINFPLWKCIIQFFK